MKTDEELFTNVFTTLIDYTDAVRGVKWGLDTYRLLEKHDKLLGFVGHDGTDKDAPFLYAVAFACIVGEYAHFAFDSYFPDEKELDLTNLGVAFENVISDFSEDMTKERMEKLRGWNVVDLEDIWGAVCKLKTEVYKELVSIYKAEGNPYPNYTIYHSLRSIFEEIDENGDTVLPSQTSGQEHYAFQYVSEGFQC
jgi:hypothetical protein